MLAQIAFVIVRSEEIIYLVSSIKRDATNTDVVLLSLAARSDDEQLATQVEDVNFFRFHCS